MTTALITFYGCNHTVFYQEPYPRVGDTLYCLKCQKARTVKSAPAEWNARCVSCTYSRNTGAARLLAERVAVKHRQKHPTHIVHIRNGKDVVVRLGPQPERLEDVTEVTPPTPLTDCPF